MQIDKIRVSRFLQSIDNGDIRVRCFNSSHKSDVRDRQTLRKRSIVKVEQDAIRTGSPWQKPDGHEYDEDVIVLVRGLALACRYPKEMHTTPRSSPIAYAELCRAIIPFKLCHGIIPSSDLK